MALIENMNDHWNERTNILLATPEGQQHLVVTVEGQTGDGDPEDGWLHGRGIFRHELQSTADLETGLI